MCVGSPTAGAWSSFQRRPDDEFETDTVRKMLRYRRPPGYRRAQPVRRPKLDAFTGIIDQILREDQSRPKKQRHTATRIGER